MQIEWLHKTNLWQFEDQQNNNQYGFMEQLEYVNHHELIIIEGKRQYDKRKRH